MNGIEIINIFEKLYPRGLAYEWDNVGLQIGTINKDINNVLLTLDLTLEVVEEAIENKNELIIVHHPLIFSPLKSIKTDTYKGKIIEKLIKSDIALYVAHTNFDVSSYGMNTMLANMLNLQKQEVLELTTEDEGLGKVGTVNSIAMKDYINTVKDIFKVNNARFIGDMNKVVNKVAITGGSGSSTIKSASNNGVDLLITGDISYHYAHDALAINLNVLDIGHNIEKFFVNELKNILKDKGVKANILISKINTDPYKFV
jgi:dinuclear metal center YbgI/SA1388 family protein